MMIDDDLYNKFCMLMFQEEIRLENNVIDAQNYILKYRPTDAAAYIKLAQAQAIHEYYDKYMYSLLRWLDYYSGNG